MTSAPYTESWAREQFKKRGVPLPPALATAPIPARRAKRGTGETAVRKANAAARLPRVLELLAMDTLPVGVLVKPVPDAMNGLERSYRDQLALELAGHRIADFDYQPIRLILAPGVTFCPDFIVRHLDGTVEIVETKGARKADGLTRLKIAVDRFPQFRFKLAGKRDGAWCELRVYGRGKPTAEKE